MPKRTNRLVTVGAALLIFEAACWLVSDSAAPLKLQQRAQVRISGFTAGIELMRRLFVAPFQEMFVLDGYARYESVARYPPLFPSVSNR